MLVGLVAASPHPRWRHSPLRRRIAMVLIAIVSALNMVSLVLLCHYPAPRRQGRTGATLIGSGIVLWVTNVLLFGAVVLAARPRRPDRPLQRTTSASPISCSRR